MAVAGLVPRESNDALPYMVSSFGISFSLTLFLPAIPEFTEWMAIVGIIATCIGLLQYNMPWDIKITRRKLRKMNQERLDTMRFWFLTFNVRLRRWEAEVENPDPLVDRSDKRPFLKGQVDRCLSDTVASSPIRKRNWRLRLMIHTLIALAVVLISLPLAVQSRPVGPTTDTPVVMFLQFVSDHAILFFFGCGITILGVVFIWWPRVWSVYLDRITSIIPNVMAFSYLHGLVGLDSVRNPHLYGEISRERESLRRELDYIQDALLRNDWSVFLVRWGILRDSLVLEDLYNLNEVILSRILVLWAKFLYPPQGVDPELIRRRFGWLIYFSQQLTTAPARYGEMHLIERAKEVSDTLAEIYQKDRNLKDASEDLFKQLSMGEEIIVILNAEVADGKERKLLSKLDVKL